jgi:diguanylate cyclase (GGDEF)-like protein
MISLRRYLESAPGPDDQGAHCERDWATLAIEAYGASLLEMGNCSLEACPGVGDGLKRSLAELKASLSPLMEADALARTEGKVRDELRGWGRGAARHYQQKAREVKEMLLSMASTAESVSARDEQCAGQMNAVTDRLQTIASLDDLTEIRASVESSAAELKASIGRMVAEGKTVLAKLRGQVAEYHARLEEAEAVASRDALTGLSSRLYVEGQIEARIATGAVFCLGLIDIDSFKRVNDEHGHLTGDELLKQFSMELRSACRATDAVGRWGGDEFVFVFDCGLTEAEARTQRLRNWICGNYSIPRKPGKLQLRVDASIGLAAHEQGEPMEHLVTRADGAMYAEKAVARRRHAGVGVPAR